MTATRPSRGLRAVQELAYVEAFDGGNFPFIRERVVATGDGEVLRGHVAVAEAIVEAWCADNPVLYVALLERWIDQARAADDKDKTFSRKWEERLAYNPKLLAALERGVGTVCERAGLTPFQTRAVELMLDGRGPTEIAFALGLNSRQAAHDRISKAFERILAMDLESA